MQKRWNVKAQSGLEYIVIIGLLIVVIVPLFFYSISRLTKVSTENLEDMIGLLRNEAQNLMQLGSFSASRIAVLIPRSVTQSEFSGNTLTVTVNGKPLKADMKVPIVGDLPLGGGKVFINLVNLNSKIYLYQCGNKKVEALEQCELDNQCPSYANYLEAACIDPGFKSECFCACASDSECPLGFNCKLYKQPTPAAQSNNIDILVAGICQPNKPCMITSECSGGEKCTGGACISCEDKDKDTFMGTSAKCGPFDCSDDPEYLPPGASSCPSQYDQTLCTTSPTSLCAICVNPDGTEVCDSGDNDCNGISDDIDQDGDGYTLCAGDCDDANPAINPGMVEVCATPYDDNCNNQTNEAGCSTGCALTSVAWNNTMLTNNTNEAFTLSGTGCTNSSITIEIFEDDTLTNDDLAYTKVETLNGISMTFFWLALYQSDADDIGGDPPEFYVKATEPITSSSVQSSTVGMNFSSGSSGGPNCIDQDNDSYSIVSFFCGQVDCNDDPANDPSGVTCPTSSLNCGPLTAACAICMHPGATDYCKDGIDSDCYGGDASCPLVQPHPIGEECGNQLCQPTVGESCITCQSDCTLNTCGNACCESFSGENAGNCNDCVCGDKICSIPETTETCSDDCIAVPGQV